jgi:DNA adenine methylase
MTTITKTTLPVIKPVAKTPLSYYGGKQSMLKDILPRIPEHRIYTEVFFGGGAVFWAKKPAEVEIINDMNREVVNFYQQLKTNFDELNKLVQQTLHSRDTHADACHIYQRPHLFSPVMRAWAFYAGTQQGFGTMIGSGWGYGNCNKTTNKISNKKNAFLPELAERLERTQIECNDAVKVLNSRNFEDAFHYIDPPYIDVHQGHYAGYLRSDFKQLLQTLEGIKGKFLLSTYPTDILAEYTRKNGWHTVELDKPLGVAKVIGGQRRRKTEVLTANYPI